MTMSAFLFLLVKVNLAMGMAVILVALLRRPLRKLFGAPIAYTIWFLVPVAGLAVLPPPPVAAPAAPVPATLAAFTPETIISHIAPSALYVTEEGVASAIAGLPPAPAYQMPDIAPLLFAAWALGLVLMAFHLTRLQLRFSAAMRRGEAGPAVLGFLRPRIVMPDSFQTHFTPREQAAILTHERVHLARQDARINALAALLRCLCWFNPLIHLGARWLRADQELACDASVVAESVSRRDYAEALLKSQIVVACLPLGCNWPGSQHPLIERIALLKRKPPGTARRVAGVSLVMVTAGFAGLGAWAAQPPVAAKPPPLPRMAALPATRMIAAPAASDTIRTVPDANSVSSGDETDAPRSVRVERANSPTPARVRMPGEIEAQMESAVATLPLISVTLNTSKTFTARSDAGTDDVVVANAPSGVGDPDGPSLATEVALGCLLGMGRHGCENLMVGADRNPNQNSGSLTSWDVQRRTSYCSGDYIYRRLDYCPDGFLETVQYLGRNLEGDDVYLAKFMHTDKTYVISQLTPEGKILKFWRFDGSPIRVLQYKRLVELRAPIRAPQTIYSRESPTQGGIHPGPQGHGP